MDDPYIGRQHYLNHIGDIYGAWDSYRGKGITIAVVDIGFNPYHKDFKRADGTSKVREDSASFKVSGGSVVKSVGVDQVVNMGESHGTFCAGVAAAAINGVGVVGIAPDADLLLLKTDAKPKSIAAAFKYAADQGARAISVSIGSYYDYGGDLSSDGSDLGTVFDEPVAYCRSKGTAVISAAGNGGLDGQPTEFTFPGCVDGVIGVGGLAANSSGEIWKGSSYNSSPAYTFCDVYAPADMMYGCCHYDNKEYDGGWNGTSFAAPQVAGMAALYFEKNPEATVDHKMQAYQMRVQALLGRSGAGRDEVVKLGRIELDQAAHVVRIDGDAIELEGLVRAAIDSQTDDMLNQIGVLAGLLDFDFSVFGKYPGWSYSEVSPMRDIFAEVCKKNGRELSISAAHGGCECGVFKGLNPKIDIISFGPYTKYIHTPDEELDLESFDRAYLLLCDIIEACK